MGVEPEVKLLDKSLTDGDLTVGVQWPQYLPESWRVRRLLEVQKQENGGAWPETVAVVLWGTDNIKTYGESLAQVSTPPQPLS